MLEIVPRAAGRWNSAGPLPGGGPWRCRRRSRLVVRVTMGQKNLCVALCPELSGKPVLVNREAWLASRRRQELHSGACSVRWAMIAFARDAKQHRGSHNSGTIERGIDRT
jgi:hypothetical protein